MKSAKGSRLSIIHTGSVKTSQGLDFVYKKTSSHTHIKETITSINMSILVVKREVSRDIIIQTVAFGDINKSLVVPRSKNSREL